MFDFQIFRNGFFIFALEFKKKLIDNGHAGNLHNLKHVMEMAAPHWESLPTDVKEEYKMKAKFSSEIEMTGMLLLSKRITCWITIQISHAGRPKKRTRFNCFGDAIEDLQESFDIGRETCEKMVLEIKNLVVDALDLGELDKKIFYFISTTSFVNSVKNVFPAELAIAKFSLKEGVFEGEM